jgi:hypothetical protein
MRRGCIGCENVTVGSDHITICDVGHRPDKAPDWCPEMKIPDKTDKRPALTWLVVAVLCLTLGIGGFSLGRTTEKAAVVPVETPEDTAIQLASQVTVLFPSALTYVQQTALEAGTGLAGVDFIYCERQTGVDALTLMAIAAHESAWGSNSWSKRYNNVMSWGVSELDPDRAYYATKTLNVLAAAQGLKRLYLSEDATYYGGDLTLWGINKYYAGDKGWADGVVAIVRQLEAKLSEEQRMKRWCVKTGLFSIPVTWNDLYKTVGWSFYKVNGLPAIAGR